MDNKKVSNNRLNKHKTDTNEMIKENESAIEVLNKINNKYSSINNASKIYRDKVYYIYNELHKKNIDFWGNDFALREAIIFHLKLKALESNAYLKLILEKILLLPNITIKSKILSDMTANSMKKEMEEMKIIENYIKNYDLENNLQETLIDFFSNISPTLYKPNSITKIYEKMKKNIKELNIESNIKTIEQDILKIIEKKEEECLIIDEQAEYINKLLLNILNEEHNKKNNKNDNKVREKTKK